MVSFGFQLENWLFSNIKCVYKSVNNDVVSDNVEVYGHNSHAVILSHFCILMPLGVVFLG